MGEPLPGDFPDPIYVKTANILLKATQVGDAGDYARYNTSGTKAWEVLTTTLITDDGATITGEGLVQLQQDVDSTGIADAVANAGAFGPGSWFYGLANAALNPNDLVMLSRVGTQFGWENERKLRSSSSAVSSSVITITTAVPHGLKVGDSITLVGFTPADFNETTVVASITDEDTFTAASTAADASASVEGLVKTPVTGEYAQAQFIKKSGTTYYDGAVANDVCVLSMLKGGQPTS